MRVRNRLHRARGVALAETAMTMSLVLLVFLGLIKITFVGFEQAEADGAAFVAAHAASMDTNSSDGSQNTRAQQYVQSAFLGYPKGDANQQVVVTSGVPVGGLTLLVSKATRVAGGLMLGQGFGGGVGQINLKSQLVEPVTVAALPAAGITATVSPSAPNCLPGNLATAAGTSWACSLSLAQPDYKLANPFAPLECHLAYLASMTGSDVTVNLAAVGTSKYGSYDISSLTNSAGQTLSQDTWPAGYQHTTGGSINDRCTHWNATFTACTQVSPVGSAFLTPQISPHINPDSDNSTPEGQHIPANVPFQQNIGGGSSGGLLGTQLTPVFEFGTASDPCPS
jgi:hypothetical protein